MIHDLMAEAETMIKSISAGFEHQHEGSSSTASGVRLSRNIRYAPAVLAKALIDIGSAELPRLPFG